MVSNPIDLIKIQQKIKTDEYDDVDDLQADVELLTNNAKSFYKVSNFLVLNCSFVKLFIITIVISFLCTTVLLLCFEEYRTFINYLKFYCYKFKM